MRNDGTQLENFVKKFYEVFGKENVTIETRKKLYKNGELFAEIDILITEKFGGMPITIAIECRDRKEVQGVDWIQQIIGRKTSFNFDKYVAISSSGFSRQAVILAKEHNIILRTTSECSTIVDDFSLISHVFPYPEIIIGEVKVATLNKSIKHFSGALIKKNIHDDYIPFTSFAIRHMPSFINRDSENWQSVYIDLPGDVYLKKGNDELVVNHLRIKGVYRLARITAKTIGIKLFNDEDGKYLGQQIRVFAPYPEGTWIDMLYILNDDGKTYTFNVLDAKASAGISKLEIKY